jgi:CheY-like chemotaxis protein
MTISGVPGWTKGAGMPKILIADDSIAVRKVAERLLTEAGLGVTLAANGEEALAYLAKEQPDVVVSDVIMPDKSGYEVCAFIRGNATLATTPVLLISGIVNDEVTKQAESCRADGVLKKPFQGTSLKDRVLDLIAKRQEPGPAAVAGPVFVPVTIPAEKVMTVSDQLQQSPRQEVSKLKEVEEQLREERIRSEELTKRLSESTEHLARAMESEMQLAIERKRANDLQETLAKVEQQVSRIPDLEAALKVEQDAVGAFKQEAANWQKASGRIAELESALHAERTAAEQLVQQLADLEQVSIKARDVEARLASAEQRGTELHQKIEDLEVELSAERRRGAETTGQLQELERVATRVREMEELLTVEQDRNELLTRRVAEAEQAAESSTKRLEEMARKLSEIARLASQLGNVRGQS